MRCACDPLGAGDEGHMLVDLDDDVVRRGQGLLLEAVGKSVIEIAVLVHGPMVTIFYLCLRVTLDSHCTAIFVILQMSCNFISIVDLAGNTADPVSGNDLIDFHIGSVEILIHRLSGTEANRNDDIIRFNLDNFTALAL